MTHNEWSSLFKRRAASGNANISAECALCSALRHHVTLQFAMESSNIVICHDLLLTVVFFQQLSVPHNLEQFSLGKNFATMALIFSCMFINY